MRFASYSSDHHTFVHPEDMMSSEHMSLSSFTAISHLEDFTTPPMKATYSYSKQLRDFLQGKLLLLDELPFSLTIIHEHYVNGYVGYEKPIVKQANTYCCQRCSNDEPRLFASFACARCQRSCIYCRKCIVMGRVSECTPLIYWRGAITAATLSYKDYSSQWSGNLSDKQLRAAHEVASIIDKPKELLIWAVTGAGKTEILFPGLEKAFAARMRVCLATPRVDVVRELAPRFNRAFPHVLLSALYGDSDEKDHEAQFVIATTHQLLRFRHLFDVMIVDEVDAFPYSIDQMLEFAVKRAKKQTGSLIYLTATPNELFKQKMHVGELAYVKIPARYHGYPLPVPTSEWCGNWRKVLQKQQLPKAVLTWCLEKLHAGRQFFLFVPSVRVLHEVEAVLRAKQGNVASVHADDPKRKQKIDAFRQGHIQLLVTTTILERGVTVPDIDVGVLGAEDDVFTENALVQIAGRVGRSAEYPEGDVRFFHYGKTTALNEAIRQIESLNNEAKLS